MSCAAEMCVQKTRREGDRGAPRYFGNSKPPCHLLGNHTLGKIFCLSVPHNAQRQAASHRTNLEQQPLPSLSHHLEELFPQKSRGSLQNKLHGCPNSVFMKCFAVKPGGLQYMPDDLQCYFAIIVYNFIWNLTSDFDPPTVGQSFKALNVHS